MLQALALRYRPRNFSELVGQEAVSTSLTHALDENRLTHAYLFSGLRGSGKTSSARIFSKALVCDHGPTSRPCEQCANCIAANEGRHIDIIEMDAASHRGIDDIKGLIEQTKYAPAIARFKIFIIDEVHMLSTPAFNALLKTLEEPPPYVKFILATTDPLKLPATVLSRTQHFRFKQISKQNIVKHLEYILNNERIAYDSGSVELLARSGSGSLRDTLTLLDQAIIYAKGELTQGKVADMLGLLDPKRIDDILALVMSGDKTELLKVVSELESYDAEMIIDEIIANLKANFLNGNDYSLLLYERFFRILSQAKGMLSVSGDNGFALTLMFFMMIEALNLRSIDDMLEETINEAPPKPSASERISVSKKEIAFQAPTSEAVMPAKNSQEQTYERFVAKIYDRDYALGECFERCNEFDGLQDGELRLRYAASEEDKGFLRKNWNVIQAILKASFEGDVKIKTVQASSGVAEAKTKNLNVSEQKPENTDASDETQAFNPQEKLAKRETIEPKFAPDLESMRDDTDDFKTAYGVKSDVGLDFLDDELREIQNGKKSDASREFELKTRDDFKNETQAEYVESSGESRENFTDFKQPSVKERLMRNASEQETANAGIDTAKNQAVLKEAERLFGEPSLENLY